MRVDGRRYTYLTPPLKEFIERRRSKLRLQKFTFYGTDFICKWFWFIFSNFRAIYCYNMRCKL